MITNADRAERAKQTLEYCGTLSGSDWEDALTDFLTDVRHLSDVDAELDFDRSLSLAITHHAEEKAEEPRRFEYFINLDERGSFSADVRLNGETVFEVLAGDELDEGDTSIFEDGYMKHKDDLDGLREYMVELGIMDEGDELVKGN